MKNLRLTDIVPGPEWGRVAPGELAAATERAVLEKMLSLTFAAQARLLRADEATASGWSPAEEAAHRTARAVNYLSLAATRLMRNYRADVAFTDSRDAVEGERCARVDALALAAMARTDHSTSAEDAARAAQAKRAADQRRAYEAYVAEMADRLRRYEPEWETPDAFAARSAAALEAGEAVQPTPSQRDGENAKTADQFEPPAEPAPQAAEAAPPSPVPAAPPRRRRGAPAGNSNARKTGRHSAAAIAERAQGRAMMREVRALCDDAGRVAGLAPRAKTSRNRANGHAA